MRKKRGTCGVCTYRFTLTKNNCLRKHGHNNEPANIGCGKRITGFCKGSGYLPTEISNESLLVARNISRKRYLICRDKYGVNDFFTTIYFDHIIKDSIKIKNWKPKEGDGNVTNN